MSDDATPAKVRLTDGLGVVDEPSTLREPCCLCGANSWRWLRCSFSGSTPQGDVDVDEYECTVCGAKQYHA